MNFIYDGEDLVLVLHNAGALSERYFHGPEVDQIFASENWLGDVLWSLGDNQGTIRDLLEYDPDANTSATVNHRVFDSFGALKSESHRKLLYAYTGREWDPDAQLYYYRARWYDPRVGRFLSEDPIRDDAANSYRYVGNSPTNATDPSGLAGNWFSDYGYYMTYEDGWIAGIGRALPKIWHAVNPATIPDDIRGLWDPESYMGDVHAYERFQNEGSAYANERIAGARDGIVDHFSTPAGWGEAYAYVATAVIAGKAGADVKAYAARRAAARAAQGSAVEGSVAGTSAGHVARGAAAEQEALSRVARQLADDCPFDFSGSAGAARAGASPANQPTRYIDGVVVVDQRSGTVLRGTVDLQPTLNRIHAGVRHAHRNDGTVFRNREGGLPAQPHGYYREYVHPTPGVGGPGPQRVIVGQGGEMYYTPDHYGTFTPINP